MREREREGRGVRLGAGELGGGEWCLLLLGRGRAEGQEPPSGSRGTLSPAVPPRHHPLSTAATEAAVKGCGREIASLWKLQVEKTKTRDQHTDAAALRLGGVRGCERPRGARTGAGCRVPGLGHQHRPGWTAAHGGLPASASPAASQTCMAWPGFCTDSAACAWSSMPSSSPFYRVSVCSPGWPRTQTSPCLCLWSPGSLAPGVLGAAGPPQGHVRRRSAPVGSAGPAAA